MRVVIPAEGAVASLNLMYFVKLSSPTGKSWALLAVTCWLFAQSARAHWEEPDRGERRWFRCGNYFETPEGCEQLWPMLQLETSSRQAALGFNAKMLYLARQAIAGDA
jgi:hypothetical protein